MLKIKPYFFLSFYFLLLWAAIAAAAPLPGRWQLPNQAAQLIVLSQPVPDSSLAVLFDASQSTDRDGIKSFNWDFGDGAQSAGSIVSHVYPASQPYTAILTLTDKTGVSVQAKIAIVPTGKPAEPGGGDNPPPVEPPPVEPPPHAQTQATGIYVVDDGDPDFAKALALPYVDGALVRAGWDQMEKTKGQYDFKAVCSKVTAAYQAGKKVSLAVYALAPAWLVAETKAYGQWTSPIRNAAQPLPWDADALAAMKAFAEAEANSTCGGYALKNHPAIAQIDTPVLGMQSIRQAPSYELGQMSSTVIASVKIWRDAFGESGHHFYVGLFPLGTSTTDAIAVRDAVQALYPDQHWFQETLTGAGPSGKLSEPLSSAKAPIMLQACGYWSQQSRIKCTFAANDSPKAGYDNVGKKLKARYFEIYPDDLLYQPYQADLEAIHKEIWQ